jgi:hypothetical protein
MKYKYLKQLVVFRKEMASKLDSKSALARKLPAIVSRQRRKLYTLT